MTFLFTEPSPARPCFSHSFLTQQSRALNNSTCLTFSESLALDQFFSHWFFYRHETIRCHSFVCCLIDHFPVVILQIFLLEFLYVWQHMEHVWRIQVFSKELGAFVSEGRKYAFLGQIQLKVWIRHWGSLHCCTPEEEWKSSHNALRLKVIYQNFSWRHHSATRLSWRKHHGVLRFGEWLALL